MPAVFYFAQLFDSNDSGLVISNYKFKNLWLYLHGNADIKKIGCPGLQKYQIGRAGILTEYQLHLRR